MVHKITSHRKENMKLELPQAIDYFTTAMTLEGKSPYTVLWHRKKLPAFAKFLQDSGNSLHGCRRCWIMRLGELCDPTSPHPNTAGAARHLRALLQDRRRRGARIEREVERGEEKDAGGLTYGGAVFPDTVFRANSRFHPAWL
jgi:hypothetical protein